MADKTVQGRFSVTDSFAISRRNEFYLIGKIIEGSVEENWFANIPLNRSLAVTVKIAQVEEIEFSNGGEKCLLLVVSDSSKDNLLLGLNIGSELIDITIDGEE